MSYFYPKLSLALVWLNLMGESRFSQLLFVDCIFVVVCVKLENARILTLFNIHFLSKWYKSLI